MSILGATVTSVRPPEHATNRTRAATNEPFSIAPEAQATKSQGVALPPEATARTLPADAKGYAVPDNLAEELARRAQEERVREEIDSQYASNHRYSTVAQVTVNGQLVAEVNSSGGYTLVKGIPGLSKQDLNADQRVKDILTALKGKGYVEVKTEGFLPGLGGWVGPKAPENVLPPFTARSAAEIYEDVYAAWRREGSASAGAKR